MPVLLCQSWVTWFSTLTSDVTREYQDQTLDSGRPPSQFTPLLGELIIPAQHLQVPVSATFLQAFSL